MTPQEGPAPRSWWDEVLEAFSARTGLALPRERREHAEDVVVRLVEARGLDPADYVRLVAENDSAFDELAAELTVGETFFFRDDSQFAMLRESFVPAIRHESDGHVVRVWSAGCASGEEAWSLAILFEDAGLGGRTQIVATDLSAAALARARAGRYRPWSLRGGAIEQAGAWLVRDGGEYVVSPRLRDRVTFARLNLADETYPPEFAAFDLVLCRNVLIYLDEHRVRGVARRLFESLVPGGWLVTGASDPPIADFAPFERLDTGRGQVLRRPPLEQTVADEKRLDDEATHPRASTARPRAARFVPRPALPESSPSRDPAEHVTNEDDAPETAEGNAAWRWAERIRAAANEDVAAAVELAAEATRAHDLDVELHYLHATLLVEAGRLDAAAEAVRRALFLDRSLVMGHLLLGTVRRRQGDSAAARRSFATARRHCRELPGEALVPLADGASAAVVSRTIDRHFALLAAQECRDS